MNDVSVPVASTEMMPLTENIHLLSSAMDEDAVLVERREGVSDLEFASVLLSHAVRYLSVEQRAGRTTSVRANRQAIKVLCDCAESLTEVERREPARMALHRWLERAKRA